MTDDNTVYTQNEPTSRLVFPRVMIYINLINDSY